MPALDPNQPVGPAAGQRGFAVRPRSCLRPSARGRRGAGFDKSVAATPLADHNPGQGKPAWRRPATDREGRLAGHRTIVGGVVAAAACAALASPAAEANTVVEERLILDGCEVGGGGNDIHSVQKFILQAQAQADAAKTEAERARLNLPRVEDLYRHRYNSAQHLDQARAAAQTTEAEYGAARKAITPAQAQLGEAQVVYSRRRRHPSRWRSRKRP